MTVVARPIVVCFLLCCLATTSSAEEGQGNPDPSAVRATSTSPACLQAIEACYRSALMSRDPLVSPPDHLRVRLEYLRRIHQEQPDSLWGKRANAALALLLLETEPTEALERFEAAGHQLPLLGEYLRFWTADALLRLGRASEAAEVFESVSTVPDTLLRTRAAYRAGDAWYKAGQCAKALDPLRRAVTVSPQDPLAPTALFVIADCHIREGRPQDAAVSFKQLWTRYPNAPEAREAAARLTLRLDGEAWQPSPEDTLTRAHAFFSLALHAEAVEEFQRFLAAAPRHPKRDEARFKLGAALVRLKRYDQARDMYHSLVQGRSSQAGESAVWLARIYLRQDDGDRLQGLLGALPAGILTGDQKAMILIFTGVWLDDHGQMEKALEKYRQAAASAEGNGQRLEALWRAGWGLYREQQFAQAAETFERVATGPDDLQWTPQVLYWLARTQERVNDRRAPDTYGQLCRRFPFTYYCQLAQSAGKGDPAILISRKPDDPSASGVPSEIRQDIRYAKAMELKWIGADPEAAKEIGALVERYAKDRVLIVELCQLLQEVGEHHQALRLARLYFRDPIERGFGEPVPTVLWSSAYPTAHLPIIRVQATVVDPLLAAAIIREESQYDPRALSRVGAVGLMQLMVGTAQTLSKKAGEGDISREDLFDAPTNIRFGVRYLDQLLQQFSGSVLYAVAAYNAGPHAVMGWIAKFGDRDTDEFVEMIPYQETRYYVKRVLRSYREYQRLLPGLCESPALDKAC